MVSTRLHPFADRVDDAVEGRLRGCDQLAHLDSPSVTGARSELPLPMRRMGEREFDFGR
jgi:hypothetical protein